MNMKKIEKALRQAKALGGVREPKMAPVIAAPYGKRKHTK